MQELGMEYQLDDIISEEDVQLIANKFAEVLLEVMKGPATSSLAKKLMITDDLEFLVRVDEYSFSGGVSELIYGSKSNFDDIGIYLAEAIKSQMAKHHLQIIEPVNKIRATVIGAGAFSLSVSGSTCYVDKNIKLPLVNIPVLPINVTYENFSPNRVKSEIRRVFKTFDFLEGEDTVALYFTRPVLNSEDRLILLAKTIEESLPNSVAKKHPIILLFEMDGARVLASLIRRNTSIQENLVCLDELYLESGDWVDIGAPLYDGDTFPVTIKSLVFKG
jgi:ethanolamine utilization protein EutA